MKLLLENWRKYLAESNKKIGILNSNYPGYVELYNPYSSNKKQAKVGAIGDKAEVISSWSDKGVKWLEVSIDGVEGWILSKELDLKQNIYSFDFDNTLIRYRTLEDGDVEYLGPHKENIELVKQLAADGNKIIIVTSRVKSEGPKRPWDDSPSPDELIAEFNLPIEEVYYTNGNLKVEKLLELGVSKHWDDDENEVAAAKEAGIEATFVPAEEGITDRLRDKWIDLLSKEEEQTI